MTIIETVQKFLAAPDALGRLNDLVGTRTGELEKAEELTERAMAIRAQMGPHPDPQIQRLEYRAWQAVDAGHYDTVGTIIKRANAINDGRPQINLSVLKNIVSWYVKTPVDVEIKNIEGGLAERDDSTIYLDASLFTDQRRHQLTPEFMAQIGSFVRGDRFVAKCCDLITWRAQAGRSDVAQRSLAIALKNRDNNYWWAQSETMQLTNRLRQTYGCTTIFEAITEN